MNIPNLLAGSILLVLGRKLFWLFVGCMGFVLGFTYAERFLGPQPYFIVLFAGIVLGILGALCAVFLQSLAVGIAGFMAGGYLTLALLEAVGFQQTQLLWAACLAGGVIGTVLLVFVFDYALIVLSSVIGASLVIRSIPLDPQIVLWVFAGLVVLGCAVQAKVMSVEPGPEGRKRRKKLY